MASINRRKSQGKRKHRRLAIIIAIFLVSLLAALAAAFGLFLFVATATYKLPDLKSRQLFKRAETSKIYDAYGNLLTNLYVEQNRVIVPLEKISPNLQEAVIAVEDRRFYEHEGVDWKAIMRALLADVREGKIVEGGSTLTQQFVKNTLISPEKTVQRKVREAALAFQVEHKYTKKEIIEGYLNTIFFGQSIYGAETAAQTYFGKSAADLTIAESATLAGVIRSPNVYSPYADPAKAKERRDMVIGMMRKQKMITAQEALEATATPLDIKPPKEQEYPFPYFVEHVKQQVLDDPKFGSTVSERANALFKGGLRIYTTIDPKLQLAADDAVWSTLNRPEDPVGSLVAIEPKTGYIRAMVGGQNWANQKLNLATQAPRQPGSSFKPFVLAAAIEQGISVSKTYESRPVVIKLPGQNWVVNNATEGRGGGQLTLRDAMINSVNAVFARLIMDVGPNKVVDLVKKMGIKSTVEALPAIALGGLGHGVTTLDMSTAYATFANGGQHTDPIAITRVTDANGNLLKENNVVTTPALDPVAAYLVTDILKDVIRAGTGRKANIGRPAAGKTGTAENYGDAWFVGFTPNYSTAVWVGYRDTNRSMNSVHGVTVMGGSFPAEIWQKFMSKAHAGVAAKDFDRPTKGLVGVKVCADMPGFAANEFCTETNWATFAKGTGPKKICDTHTAPPNVKVPNVIGMTAEEARTALESAGFTVNVKTIDRVGIPAGQVGSQLPTEGTEIPQGSPVDIEVSTGRAPSGKIKMPGVVGTAGAQAQAVLSDLGLKAIVVLVDSDPDKKGVVVGQTPKPNASILVGSIVTIRVGK